MPSLFAGSRSVVPSVFAGRRCIGASVFAGGRPVVLASSLLLCFLFCELLCL